MTDRFRQNPLRDGWRAWANIACGVMLLLVVAVGLAGCGKKGDPQPPPGEPNTYPRVYPHG